MSPLGEMRLSSVNVGRKEPIWSARRSGTTGIFKRPVEGPVEVRSRGLSGDHISDTENHGGPDQAVYVYGEPDYAWWSEELGRQLPAGAFGENLAISGLESAEACIGDRMRVGTVVLEVTAPRIPCVTLATRMGDPSFVRRFRRAERPGLYCRVIEAGQVRKDDRVTIERYEGEAVPAVELFRDFFDPRPRESTVRRHLAAPLAVRARIQKERQLQELLAPDEGTPAPREESLL
jgi:MOSC domain-containing protein YiiM